MCLFDFLGAVWKQNCCPKVSHGVKFLLFACLFVLLGMVWKKNCCGKVPHAVKRLLFVCLFCLALIGNKTVRVK